MKYISPIFFLLLVNITHVFAIDPDSKNNVLWIKNKDIRDWNIHLDDIPGILQSAINFFMGIAGTVAVIFVIIWAYKILFGSLQQDKTKGRDTIFMALWGFAIAALAWFIVKLILSNLW